jgi:MoxR-like ATPase
MMTTPPRLTFRNDPKYRPKNSHSDSPTEPEPYSADPELINAVNLAIFLKRPLLLEGEAGCGKTRLASAVAYELGLPLYRWNIRSDTTAKEGQYQYDAIARLHDVQIQNKEQNSSRDPRKPEQYLKLGALGKAFACKTSPAVVLIDEIDKADVDFPNDLLTVLDAPWSFFIPEIGKTIKASSDKTKRPIVIITSNKEKGNLPAPFLRRCLYYYLEFPKDSQRLQEIVQLHYQTKIAPPQPLTEVAIDRFLTIRQAGGLFKVPGTSEFLDWLEALTDFESKSFDAETLRTLPILPYRELLFKLRADWHKSLNPANPT